MTPNVILNNVKASSKKQLLEVLCMRAADATGLNASDLLAELLDREQIGSTGIGFGVAIPHLKCQGLAQPQGILAKLDTPVDFNAVDDAPVDLVYLLLAPQEETSGVHLKALAEVSRFLRDATVCHHLRNSETRACMQRVVGAWYQDRDIAVA